MGPDLLRMLVLGWESGKMNFTGCSTESLLALP
jgi:hypothetical protein